MVNRMEERIAKFIVSHRLLTLATTEGHLPFCCNVFYVFHPEKRNFYFMSSSETKHVQDAITQPMVAGTIVSGDVNIANIQGIQFTGRFFQPKGDEFDNGSILYMKKFPLAHFISSSLWTIEPDFIKMTDNTLGFGKKILWHRYESIPQL
jgi:uncharacterized protein